MVLCTSFTKAFNLTVPVCLAPMAGASGGRLAGVFCRQGKDKASIVVAGVLLCDLCVVHFERESLRVCGIGLRMHNLDGKVHTYVCDSDGHVAVVVVTEDCADFWRQTIQCFVFSTAAQCLTTFSYVSGWVLTVLTVRVQYFGVLTCPPVSVPAS